MGRLIAFDSVTLDGVMQAPGGTDEDTRGGFTQGGWAPPYFDEVMFQFSTGGQVAETAMLFGRRTYEQFYSYWPQQSDNPYSEILNLSRKYVVSRKLQEPLPWENSHLLTGDPVESVAAIKLNEGMDMTMLGSGVLLRSLLPVGLVDELILLIHPLVLGSGHKLFPNGDRLEMDLVDTVTTTTGVIIATYRPAGKDRHETLHAHGFPAER